MPTESGKLGVGVMNIGWCASQHIQAFQKNPHTVDPEELRRADQIPEVTLRDARSRSAGIDELVECVRAGRDTHLNVFDAQKTMGLCLAVDRSAERGGAPVRLPLIT